LSIVLESHDTSFFVRDQKRINLLQKREILQTKKNRLSDWPPSVALFIFIFLKIFISTRIYLNNSSQFYCY